MPARKHTGVKPGHSHALKPTGQTQEVNPNQLGLDFDKPTATPVKRRYSKRSTATEAQYHRIVKMLRALPKSTLDFRKNGIMAPAARIKELIDNFGFDIRQNPADLVDSDGFLHKRVGIYTMLAEPEGWHHESA